MFIRTELDTVFIQKLLGIHCVRDRGYTAHYHSAQNSSLLSVNTSNNCCAGKVPFHHFSPQLTVFIMALSTTSNCNHKKAEAQRLNRTGKDNNVPFTDNSTTGACPDLWLFWGTLEPKAHLSVIKTEHRPEDRKLFRLNTLLRHH